MIALLRGIGRDSYDTSTVKKLERYTKMDNFYEQHMRSICNEAAVLCEWVLAVTGYIQDKSIMEPNNKRYTDLVSQVKVTQKKLRTTNNQIDGMRIALLQLDRTLQKNVNEVQETKAEDRTEMIDNIEKRETVLDEVYSRVKTEISKMPEAKKQPEEAIEEHTQNLQVRQAMILEIESCIKSGEMALDVNAMAKASEHEALNEMPE
jgi:chromosome segregation ATPase